MKRIVVSNVYMHDGNLSCIGKDGKEACLFKKQGSLDGACATYSVIMDLLVLGAISDSDTAIHAEYKSKTTKKLFKVFCQDYGMHRDEQTFFKIKRMLTESFDKEVDASHRLTNGKDSIDAIIEGIDNDIPVIISVSNSEMSHAMLAIGYEENDGAPGKILCLDPSGDYIHGRKRWNATIDLTTGRKYYSYETNTEGIKDISKVELGDIIIITKKQQ